MTERPPLLKRSHQGTTGPARYPTIPGLRAIATGLVGATLFANLITVSIVLVLGFTNHVALSQGFRVSLGNIARSIDDRKDPEATRAMLAAEAAKLEAASSSFLDAGAISFLFQVMLLTVTSVAVYAVSRSLSAVAAAEANVTEADSRLLATHAVIEGRGRGLELAARCTSIQALVVQLPLLAEGQRSSSYPLLRERVKSLDQLADKIIADAVLVDAAIFDDMVLDPSASFARSLKEAAAPTDIVDTATRVSERFSQGSEKIHVTWDAAVVRMRKPT